MNFSFKWFLFVLLFQCSLYEKPKNFFDIASSGGALLPLFAFTGFQTEFSISTHYDDSEYPLFVKTGVLDVEISEDLPFQFTATDVKVNQEYEDFLILRDLFYLEPKKIRMVFSASTRAAWKEDLSLKINVPSIYGNYHLTNPMLNFQFPKSKVVGEISEFKSRISTILLSDGRILLVGGISDSNSVLDTVEIFDPVSNSTTVIPPLDMPVVESKLVLLQDGNVLVSGGKFIAGNITNDSQISNHLYLINPVQNTTTRLPFGMVLRRVGHSVTRLPNGNILVVGGLVNGANDVSSVSQNFEIINLQSSSSASVGNMAHQRMYHESVLCESTGNVYIMGGLAVPDFTFAYRPPEVEIFDPKLSMIYDSGLSLINPRTESFVFTFNTSEFILAGGYNASNQSAKSIDLWSFNSNRANTLSFTERSKYGAAVSKFSNNQIIFTGGMELYYKSAVLEMYDHVEKKNYLVDTMVYPRSYHSAIQANDGIYIFGDSTFAGRYVEYYGKK
ncbi:kelch repeat-containing protein [Leptospira sp. 96542]|nr:kelch repeat-containing protein [Leptospira sp. 96542]